MVAGHVELLDAAVLQRVPLELVVAPELLHPQVGRHDLVLQVLKHGDGLYLQLRPGARLIHHYRAMWKFSVGSNIFCILPGAVFAD